MSDRHWKFEAGLGESFKNGGGVFYEGIGER
jgi:hypothetical protein